MNVFHKVALQGLLKNRTRTIVTIIGVILSSALFTAIATFGTSLINYMIQMEVEKTGNWHVTFSDVAATQIQEWENDENVKAMISYENIGYAVLEGAGEGSAKKPYLFIAGFQDETYDTLPVNMISGRLPENSEEVIVPAASIAIKAEVRISVGDTLTLMVGEREHDGNILTQCNPYMENETLVNMAEKTYTVVGTFDRPGFESHSAAGYTIITKADEENPADSYSLFIALENPRRVQAYADSRSVRSPYEVNEDVLRFMGISENKVFNMLMYTVGGVLAAIVMVGSVFLIYNSFHISLNERVHQFGILMSVGATSRQLQNSVLFEGICIGIVGIPFGILSGIASVRVLLPVVAENFANVFNNINSSKMLTLSISFPMLAAAAVISLITILISAYIPTRKAVSTPVMECIRQTNAIRTEAKSVKTGKTIWRLYGLEGALALKNFKRNKSRYRSIVLSLSLSVVLAVSGNAFSTELKRLTNIYTAQTADGDVLFFTDDMTEDRFVPLYDKVKKVEGVYRSTWQTDAVYSCMTDELPGDFLSIYREAMGDESIGQEQQITLYAMFIEDAVFYEYVESLGLSKEEYSGEDAKVFICLMDSEEHTTFFEGISMNFTFDSLSGELTVCGTFENDYPLDGVVVIKDDPAFVFCMTAPLSARPQFAGIETVDGLTYFGAHFWSKTPSQTVAGAEAALRSEGVAENYTLFNLSQAFELSRNLTFVVDIFTYVFVFMITLIAVANVFNTISTNIMLRRRELAMLRSVGMSDRDFNRMMNFECMFYGMRTLLYGIPIATALSWLIHMVLITAEDRNDIAFAFPWVSMSISVLGVFAIVFITMLYATNKIRKENIIDALRDDMA